jgi:hypothetical protein
MHVRILPAWVGDNSDIDISTLIGFREKNKICGFFRMMSAPPSKLDPGYATANTPSQPTLRSHRPTEYNGGH